MRVLFQKRHTLGRVEAARWLGELADKDKGASRTGTGVVWLGEYGRF